MGWLGSIFSTNAADKAVDGIYNGIDNMFYTEEEKAVARQKIFDTKIKIAKALEPFKVAQRAIALSFTLNFILAFWAIGVMMYFDINVDKYIELVGVFNFGWIMMSIVAFYFTGGLTDVVKASKKKI